MSHEALPGASPAVMLHVRLCAPGGAAETVPLTLRDGAVRSEHPGIDLTLRFMDGALSPAGRRRYRVELLLRRETRVEFLFSPVADRPAFHILPGFLFGSNNLPISGPGHFPNLTTDHPESPSCSPVWSMRTDRNAAPVSMAFIEGGGCLAVAGPPYLDIPGGFVRTGLLAALPATVGYAVGYRNSPRTFINKDKFGDPTEQCVPAGTRLEFSLDVFSKAQAGREAAFPVVREIYDLYYEAPRTTLSAGDCIAAIAEMVVRDSWDPDKRAFIAQDVKGLPDAPVYRKIGGRAIAWVGGVNVAWPLLEAGYRLGRAEWIDVARQGFDRIAAHKNPANGLFFDAFTEDWQPTVNYWWSGNTNRDVHSAYTNAEAAWYLLRGSVSTHKAEGRGVPAWEKAALDALRTILRLQREDGHYGYSYAVDKPAVVSWDGFAGCWWTAAMALAHRLTGEEAFLDSARRALNCYWRQVRTLDVWGTPMDTWKSNDEEGVLAFLRSARLIHEITGDPRCLEMLAFGAEYEFLWRYLYNARPQSEPLASAGWCSSGGSITSVSNPHIHPMGLLVSGDLQYLWRQGGDPHVRRRMEDGLVWARNCIEIFPEKAGYGRRGWTGERYCPSDGLLIAKYADGRPASTELGLNLWAASAMAEGLLETEEGAAAY